ncbi:MAG: hypothetical protein M1829_001792 [Trizodia sp. TS-e1964]|nr:MAG: hypothetical protein M1829_001792 [Trizodia sp. TS-e1964]
MQTTLNEDVAAVLAAMAQLMPWLRMQIYNLAGASWQYRLFLDHKEAFFHYFYYISLAQLVLSSIATMFFAAELIPTFTLKHAPPSSLEIWLCRWYSLYLAGFAYISYLETTRYQPVLVGFMSVIVKMLWFSAHFMLSSILFSRIYEYTDSYIPMLLSAVSLVTVFYGVILLFFSLTTHYFWTLADKAALFNSDDPGDDDNSGPGPGNPVSFGPDNPSPSGPENSSAFGPMGPTPHPPAEPEQPHTQAPCPNNQGAMVQGPDATPEAFVSNPPMVIMFDTAPLDSPERAEYNGMVATMLTPSEFFNLPAPTNTPTPYNTPFHTQPNTPLSTPFGSPPRSDAAPTPFNSPERAGAERETPEVGGSPPPYSLNAPDRQKSTRNRALAGRTLGERCPNSSTSKALWRVFVDRVEEDGSLVRA